MTSFDEQLAADASSSANTATFDRGPLLHAFEESWQASDTPMIEVILARLPVDAPGAETARRRLLEGLVQIDLAYRWREPRPPIHENDLPARPLLEDYIRRFPLLGPLDALPLELIGAEYRVRRSEGDHPEVETYRARFPAQAQALLSLLTRIDAGVQEHGFQTTLLTGTERRTPSRGVPDGYEILSELGRGGMGIVYKARQFRLNRLVALKMIASGERASSEERARFRTETEAVARIHHANVVQVYEVGEQDGQPFCVLEYVNSGSLAHRLAGAPLQPRVAARLLETLASAVQAVHEQGILHRDLKPANVLLHRKSSLDPPKPEKEEAWLTDFEPKISDFGLARRTESAGLTQTGAVLGSPSYMAPEQAETRKGDIGPATDVYGLGATLYELLTGRPPFRGVTILETLEQVRHREALSPRQLQPAVPRDLDIICLKCLHKDPRKRYASAAALAEDLERFRLGQPIHARPSGRWERGLKWARRRPALATLAAVLVLGVIATVAGTLTYTVNLRAAQAETRHQQEQSARNYRKALQSVEQMLFRLGARRLDAIPGTEQVREDALHDAIRLYQELQADQPEPDPDLYARLGSALTSLAHLRMAMGRHQQAEEDCRRGMELLESLPADLRETPACRHQMAFGQYIMGNILAATNQRAEAERLYLQACASLDAPAAAGDPPSRRLLTHCYAGLGMLCGDFTRRQTYHRRELELSEAFYKEEPDRWENCNRLGQSLHNVAMDWQSTGNLAEAEKLYRRGLTLLEPFSARTPRQSGEHADHALSQTILVQSHLSLGALHLTRRQPDKAEVHYKNAVALSENRARLYPQASHQEELAQSYTTLASLYQVTNRGKEAGALYQKVLAIREPLVRDLPHVALYRLTLAETYVNLGLLLSGSRSREALAIFQKGRDLLEPLLRDHPGDSRYAIALGGICNNQARLVRDQDGPRKALTWHDRAVAVLLAAHRRNPVDGGCRHNCAMVLGSRAQTWTALAEHKKALADWDCLLEVVGPTEADKYRFWRGMTLIWLGDHRRASADIEKALRRVDISHDERYNCVCIFSLAAAAALSDGHLSETQRRQAADGYAARALDVLSQLRQAGYFKTLTAWLRLGTDPDLAALRSRDDFRRWCLNPPTR